MRFVGEKRFGEFFEEEKERKLEREVFFEERSEGLVEERLE